ncbi:DNA adenine methylase [Sorangium sp. So ce388]|uniref:DNA adenine methylase n=1 Tax=Sorangium sp. So ce388 TaxID=3133309 RepID=UPI003F5C9E6A
MKVLRPAYPYFGSKAQVADVIWAALGNVPNYVEPFCGSAAVLLARPDDGKVETVNDLNAFITNFLRAVAWAPEETAEHASWCVSEIDMHARHASLLARAEELEERLRSDPKAFDTEVAGWWVWGQAIWIGSGWCDATKRPAIGGSGGRPHYGRGVFGLGKRPALGGHGGAVQRGYPKSGVGIFRTAGQLPSLSGSDGTGVGYGRGIFATGRREDLVTYFRALSSRLDPRRVRITCGDWSRVVTPAVTISHGLTGVFLDAPYGEKARRTRKLYANDSLTVADDARVWALEQGDDPRYRIVLAGYEGEHEMPPTWRVHAWKANGGYGNQDRENANASKERLWFSPHCLGGSADMGPLFARAGGAA